MTSMFRYYLKVLSLHFRTLGEKIIWGQSFGPVNFDLVGIDNREIKIPLSIGVILDILFKTSAVFISK